MTFFLWVAGILGAIGILRVTAVRRRAKLDDFWEREAAALGLDWKGGTYNRYSIAGTLNGCRVYADTFEKDEDQWLRVLVVDERIPDGIVLKREGRFAGLKKAVLGQDILTGDKRFDDAVNVSGIEPAALALLNEGARRAVADLVEQGGGVRDACFVYERKFQSQRGAIADPVRMLIRAASRLDGGSLDERLAKNALEDPLPEVRIRNLQVLAERFPEAASRARAIQSALGDRDPAVRLAAADLAGGQQAIAVIRSVLEDANASDEVRAQAVRVAIASEDRSLLEPVKALVAKHDPGLAEIVAHALGDLGGAECETPLLRLLNRESVEVKRAAAEALGKLGSIRSVEPLLEAEKQGLSSTAARDAVRRIQGRLGPAESGGLSLTAAEGADGGLSVAPASGELSLAGGDKKERS